jgi:hypothetical protein
MKRCTVILALVLAMACTPTPVRADDAGPLFTTPLLGASFGAMAGFLASLFTQEPQEHYDYVGIGAGIGAAVGLALGIADVAGPRAGFYRRGNGQETLYGFTVTFPLRQ